MDAEYFKDTFAVKIMEGRNEGIKEYMSMFYWFGDIFSHEDMNRREMMRRIAEGKQKITDIITGNMEAFMLTVLETGCTDWENYMNSEDYQKWKKKSDMRQFYGNNKFRRPVSGLDRQRHTVERN